MLNVIKQSNSIEKLELCNFSNVRIIDILKHNKTLKELSITRTFSSPQDVLLLADSLKFNNSVKILQYYDDKMDETMALNFLTKLVKAYTLWRNYT